MLETLSLSFSIPECLNFIYRVYPVFVLLTQFRYQTKVFELAFTLILFAGAMKCIAPTNLYIKSE